MPAVVFIAIVRRIVNSQRSETAVRGALRRGDAGELVEAAAADAAKAGPSFPGRVARAFVLLTVVAGLTWVAGQLVARRMSYGDEASDEFQLAVIMGGEEFHSSAPQLRAATVYAIWAGVSLDLRRASLGPDGADLMLQTTLADVEVIVPASWRVEVDQVVSGGAFELDLPEMDGLPDDAPTLRIRSVTRIGGGLVTSTRE